MSAPTLMRLMALSISTAKRAGAIIREVMQKGDLKVIDKGIDDPQTEADRLAQNCIIASLSKKFPGIDIIGEEGCRDLSGVSADFYVTEEDQEFLQQTCPEELCNIKDEEFVVWVDPLDGTSEYTQGFLDHVTVLIGIAVRNAAVGGVIHQPYYKNNNGEMGRTIWGLKDLGTGGFEPKTPPAGKLIVTTTRSHMTPVVLAAVDALAPSEVVQVGGAGYKVIQLLEGKAHVYVMASAGCKKWDTCAPEAVLQAHGGCLTDVLGAHYTYAYDVEHPNTSGVLATAAGVPHQEIVSKIPEYVKKSMRA